MFFLWGDANIISAGIGSDERPEVYIHKDRNIDIIAYFIDRHLLEDKIEFYITNKFKNVQRKSN